MILRGFRERTRDFLRRHVIAISILGSIVCICGIIVTLISILLPGPERTVVPPSIELSRFVKPLEEKVMENTELVLDCSAAMSEPFAGGTKLEAAFEEIDRLLLIQIADADNLAFRQFGGGCDSDNTRLLVSFGQNQKDEVRTAARSVKVGGEAPLVTAVVEATSDFNEIERFAEACKRIIVILGSESFCEDDPMELIRQRLESRKDDIELSFVFIGDSSSATVTDELARIATATGGFFSPRKPPDLMAREVSEVFGTVIEFDPKIVSTELRAAQFAAGEDVTFFVRLLRLDNLGDGSDAYYLVDTVARRKKNVGHYFANTVAFWTLGDQEAELIAYQPLPGLHTTMKELPLLVGNAPFLFDSLADSPGFWEVDHTQYVKEDWNCTQLSWQMVFEMTFCWEKLETVSIWRVPLESMTFIDIQPHIATARGGCMAMSTHSTVESAYIRFDLSQL